MILKTELENPNNSKFGTPGGKKTKDCIFLLSESEVRQFLPTADARKAYTSETITSHVKPAGGCGRLPAREASEC